MIGGLLALAISGVLGLEVGGAGATPEATMFGWQVKTALILVPMLIYGGLFLFEPFPVTERVASGVSTREMLSQALAADVPALGVLHGADGRDRAGAPGDAEPRAGEDGRDERDLDPDLYQLADVRCCGTSPARSPTAFRRSGC